MLKNDFFQEAPKRVLWGVFPGYILTPYDGVFLASCEISRDYLFCPSKQVGCSEQPFSGRVSFMLYLSLFSSSLLLLV